MRRRMAYALEIYDMERRAEIERQQKIQAEIRAREVEHAKQQRGILFDYVHEHFDAVTGEKYTTIEVKPPYNIEVPGQETLHHRSPDDVAQPPEQTASPGGEFAQAASIQPVKRRGRPPKVR